MVVFGLHCIPDTVIWIHNGNVSFQSYEASCHLLAAVPWHCFVLCQNTSLGVMVGQVLKCECWQYEGLMCTICYACQMCAWQLELSSMHHSVCYSTFVNRSGITKFSDSFRATPLLLIVSLLRRIVLIFSRSGDSLRVCYRWLFRYLLSVWCVVIAVPLHSVLLLYLALSSLQP
jgi:hypothetical protein